MEQKKVVFLGAKRIAYECFQYLIAKSEELNIQIVGLKTNYKPERDGAFNLNDLANQSFIPLLSDLNDCPQVDFIISIQYHEILKQHHIEKASELAMNLHLAPLPEYRGCNQFSMAIMEDRREFGVTIHEIDEGIDSGPILFEKRFAISPDIWVNELVDMSVEYGIQLFKDKIFNLIYGDYIKISQGNLVADRGTKLIFRNAIDELKVLCLSDSQSLTERKIRATYMPGFSPPYFLIGNEKMEVIKAEN